MGRRSRIRRIALALSAAGALCLALAPAASAFEWLGQYAIGQYSPGPGGVSSSVYGVSVEPDGTVVAADAGLSRVSVFSASGRFARAFGKDVSLAPGEGPEICVTDCKAGVSGPEAGALNSPYGVVASSQEVYVAEYGGNRISVFDTQGHFLRAFGKDVGGPGVNVCTNSCTYGSSGNSAGALSSPYGLALDAAGELFVAEPSNERVSVFDAQSGQFIRAFGKGVGGPGVNVCTTTCTSGEFSPEPGGFASPYGLAIGPDGNLYVAEEGASRISVFTTGGQYLRSFGSLGSGAGNLEDPFGVAVAPDGTVYVDDTYNYRISIFGPDGGFRRAMGWNVAGSNTGATTCTAPCQSGSSEYGIGGFYDSYAIATDCRGAVYVANYYRIDKFGEPASRRPPCESNAFSFGSISKNKRKGILTAVVKVPSGGTLTVGAGARLSASAPQPVGPGNVQVTVKAAGRGVKTLAKKGKLKGSLTVSFAPPNEDPSTQSEAIQLTKTVKKHKKTGKHKGGNHKH